MHLGAEGTPLVGEALPDAVRGGAEAKISPFRLPPALTQEQVSSRFLTKAANDRRPERLQQVHKRSINPPSYADPPPRRHGFSPAAIHKCNGNALSRVLAKREIRPN